MSSFADFLIEFAATGSEPLSCPSRVAPWVVVPGSFGDSRLRLSLPSNRNKGGFAEQQLGPWRVWCIGEIGNYLGARGDTDECIARFLNDLLEEKAKPEALGGRFLLLGWCERTRSWSVWTDRMGGVQAYFCQANGRAVLGTFSPAVYAYSSRNLDWTGLTNFFSLGFFAGDRTHYSDCRILRPGSRYEYGQDGTRRGCTQYWRWSHNPDERRNEADTIAQFGDLFASAVDRQTSAGRVVLPLSGGLDSRTVAACIPKGRQVSTFSYGYGSASVETAISREVADAAGLPFHSHIIRPYLFEKLDLVLQSVEGFQDLTQSRQADMSEWLGVHADRIIGAHWGDVLCDDVGLDSAASAEQQISKLVSKTRKNGGDWLAANLCGPHLGGDTINFSM